MNYFRLYIHVFNIQIIKLIVHLQSQFVVRKPMKKINVHQQLKNIINVGEKKL